MEQGNAGSRVFRVIHSCGELRPWTNGRCRLRLCSGCRSKVEDGVQFCDECCAERAAVVAVDDGIRSHSSTGRGVYDAVLDGLRKGTRWQRGRAMTAKRCPLCARCWLPITEIIDH